MTETASIESIFSQSILLGINFMCSLNLKQRRWLCAGAIALCFGSKVLADEPDSGYLKIFVPELWENLVYQAKAPFLMSRNQALGLGAGALVTAGLFQVDIPVSDEARSLGLDHPWMAEVSPYISDLGGTAGILSIGGVGLFGWLADRSKEQETAYLMAQAVITSGLWCRIGKTLTARTRPSAAWNGTKYVDHWHRPLSELKPGSGSVTQYDAFPSGHTTSFVSMLTVLSCQYGEEHPWVPIASCTATAVFGVARIVEETHWISDVFVGACLGYLCGRQVVNHHRQKDLGSKTEESRNIILLLPIDNGEMAFYSRAF